MKEIRGRHSFFSLIFLKNGIAIYVDFGGITAIWIIDNCYLQL